MRANDDIRNYARNHGVCLWEIATALGYSEGHFSRKLRFELSGEEKQIIRGVIDDLVIERAR